MKIHDEIDDWMAGALCDALSPVEKLNFEQHLAECPHCRSLYEETQKMNDLLNTTLPELRPDPAFEGRVIAGFRAKISRSRFHPWAGLVWLAQFRPAQAVLALLIAVAMIKTGSKLTGERFPSGPVASNPVFASDQFWTDDESFKVNINTASEGTFEDGPVLEKEGVSGPKFADNVQDVKKLFTEADSFYNAGRYDLAYKRYDQVLNLDPYNTTARQGQQKVNAAREKYAQESYNATRSYLVWQVADKWQLPPPRKYTAYTAPHNQLTAYDKVTAFASTVSGTNADRTYATVDDLNSRDGGANGKNNATVDFNFAGSTINSPVYDSRAGTFRGGGATKSLISGDLGFVSTSDALARGSKQDGDGKKLEDVADASFWKPYNDYVANQPGDTYRGIPVATAPSGAPIDTRKLIRNAGLEFEVDNFEKSAQTIAAVAKEENSYVATQNSEKGANGKLQGVIVVKVVPANLDHFLLKLRSLGELKNQTVATEDVTKAYFDTESRMRNSKAMEERLIDMLKKNTGKVSDLLLVEKELARVREEIEKMQGELKYMDSLVLYATVNIVLREKELNQAAAYLLREQANLSLFSKDVEKAFADAKAVADAAKAQIVDSHIQRDEGGRVVANLHLLFPPETSEEAIMKLKAIGRIQNFNSQTARVARNGSGNSDVAKIERDKVELTLVIMRDEGSAAQSTDINILTDKVEEKTAQIKQAAAATGVEVKDAGFNREPNGIETSGMRLRLPMSKYPAFIEQVKSLGKVKDFAVNRSDDAATPDAPVEITLRIFNQGNIVPDQTGLWTTVRKTLGDGFGALMWSVRMIGVSLAFVAPWAVALCIIIWVMLRRRRSRAAKK